MTDTSVQFFTQNNGFTLNNNWGDLIRMLDAFLVNGKPLPSIIRQNVDNELRELTLEFSSNHNCSMLQVVQLSGFTPAKLDSKYRIVGIPDTLTLVLKLNEEILEPITAVGISKLAPLGYEIVFRDEADVKRVYRAIDPTSNHPFIRVDESRESETGSYTETYTKYAMVGLLESMTNIDDYDNPDVLQLPFDNSNTSKNWSITGTGSSVVRGWSKWIWARNNHLHQGWADSLAPTAGSRFFTLVGDKDAFYLVTPFGTNSTYKRIYGAGLFNSNLKTDVIPNWFLMSRYSVAAADSTYSHTETYGNPLVTSDTSSRFLAPRYDEISRLSNSTAAIPILPDYFSGNSGIYSANNISCLEIPFSDSQKYLRGSLKHVNYVGKSYSNTTTAVPEISDGSMYVRDTVVLSTTTFGTLMFYLGEL